MIVANGSRCYFFFLYCFNCVPPLAKPGMCKPGLRSERERITPPADWSTVGNALGGTTESIPVQVQHTSEHQGRMQHFCLSSQQLIVIKEKKKLRRVFTRSTHDNNGLIDCLTDFRCYNFFGVRERPRALDLKH